VRWKEKSEKKKGTVKKNFCRNLGFRSSTPMDSTRSKAQNPHSTFPVRSSVWLETKEFSSGYMEKSLVQREMTKEILWQLQLQTVVDRRRLWANVVTAESRCPSSETSARGLDAAEMMTRFASVQCRVLRRCTVDKSLQSRCMQFIIEFLCDTEDY